MKTILSGLYGCQTAEKQHSLPPRLLDIMNSFELKRGYARAYTNENEEQL